MRRQTVSFSWYITVIGFLLALAATTPCHGHKALRVANERSDKIKGILTEETPDDILTVAHDNKADRSLDEDGNPVNEEEEDGDTNGDEEEEPAEEAGEAEDEQADSEDTETVEGQDEQVEETETEGEGGDEQAEEEQTEVVDEAEDEGNVEDPVVDTDTQENEDPENIEEPQDNRDGDGDPDEDQENVDPDAEPENEDQEQIVNPGEDEGAGDTPEDAVDETTEGEETQTENLEDQQETVAEDEEENIVTGKEEEPVEETANKNSEGSGEKTGGEDASGSTAGASKSNEVPTKWEDDYGEPAVGKYVVGIFLLIGIVVYFKCCRKSGGGPMSPSSNRGHGKGKYETVATDEFDGDGDDWGWDGEDDNSGDVELAAPTIPPPSGLSLKQRSPSVEKREVKSPGATRQKALQLPKAQNLHSMSQPSPQPMSQPPMITSLGAPKPAVKKTTPRKPKEDDIFASMGLTAKPKFETSRPAAKASGGGWGSVAAAAPAAGVAVPTPSASYDAGDWGGDDDLDDLFDD